MNIFLILFNLILALSIGLRPSDGSVSVEPQAIQFEWEQVIQDENAEYDYRAATLGHQNGDIWIVVGSRPKGNLGVPQGFLLWHLDKRGTANLRIDLNPALKNFLPGFRYANIVGITTLAADRIALVGRVEPAGTLLLILEGATGRFLQAIKIEPDRNIFLTKVIGAADGNLLLLGRSGSSGWVARVNSSGKTIWEQRLGSKGVAAIVDGYTSDGGSVVVLGNPEGTPSNPITWVGKLKAGGELVAEIRLTGNPQGIASSADGSTIIIGESGGSHGKDIGAWLLTARLENKKSLAVLAGVKNVFPFKLASFSDEGWVVVGSNSEYLPWIGLITKDGELRWTETRRFEPQLIPVTGRLGVLSEGGKIFALFSLFMLNEKGEQRQMVRVMQFTAQ